MLPSPLLGGLLLTTTDGNRLSLFFRTCVLGGGDVIGAITFPSIEAKYIKLNNIWNGSFLIQCSPDCSVCQHKIKLLIRFFIYDLFDFARFSHKKRRGTKFPHKFGNSVYKNILVSHCRHLSLVTTGCVSNVWKSCQTDNPKT
jgi:hypothetical protein